MAATLLLALGGAALGGCVSTQEKNARAKIVADRTLDGRRPLRVERRARDVRVAGVAIVHGRRRAAVVATLHNAGDRAVTDVPIAVGVRAAGGRRVQLNGGRGLEWYDTHVPAIGAGETVSWVFVPSRRALPTGRPWALAGRARAATAVPRIAASVAPTASRGGDRGRRAAEGPRAVHVALANRSDVPQFGLRVYAVARAHGRVVAAGVSSLRHLGSHERASARVALVGTPGRHPVRVAAPATIYE